MTVIVHKHCSARQTEFIKEFQALVDKYQVAITIEETSVGYHTKSEINIYHYQSRWEGDVFIDETIDFTFTSFDAQG